MRLYRTTSLQKYLYPSLVWRLECQDEIYLTFDDGPTKEVTPWVLNELEKVGAKATFFCIGQKLADNWNIAREVVASGHTLGNHTYDHVNGWKVKKQEYFESIRRCDEQLGELNGSSTLFRPPYGRIGANHIRELKHKKIVMWSHLAWDFASSFKSAATLAALGKARGGDIVLFHDSGKAFSNLRQVLPQLLAHYKAKGLRFQSMT